MLKKLILEKYQKWIKLIFFEKNINSQVLPLLGWIAPDGGVGVGTHTYIYLYVRSQQALLFSKVSHLPTPYKHAVWVASAAPLSGA